MKKGNLITGILFTITGILFFAASCLDTPLGSLFCGLAGAGLGPGILMIAKYLYWTQPSNRERYSQKAEMEQIEFQDERKEMLRGKTARYLYGYTLTVVGISCIMFQVLDKFGLIQSGRIFIVYLGILFFSELFLASLIYKWLDKKY